MARILCLAQTAEVFHAEGGVRAVRRVIRRRPGRWFDPALVDALRGARRRGAEVARRRRRTARPRGLTASRPAQWRSMTRSIRPYSTAWSALKKRSRSMSACTRSSVCPVCFA